MITFESQKKEFFSEFNAFLLTISKQVMVDDGQWTMKGFVDTYRNIYALSSDTKLISKILELHLLPYITSFAKENKYAIVLPNYQNYYPDLSFVDLANPQIKFAVDLKTTYRLPDYPGFCNGFTLGSHGTYFIDRSSTKNIQFPYKAYAGHFCLGVIYSRLSVDYQEGDVYKFSDLQSIASVIGDFEFFVAEKWQIASDKSGSGNTANIGSIANIADILAGQGVFSRLGEIWFDDYWMNYGKIHVTTNQGEVKRIRNLIDFVEYRGGDASLIVPKAKRRKGKRV